MNRNEGDADSIRAVSVATIARAFEVSTYTVYEAINRGELPAKRIKSRLRVKVKDAEAWYDALPNVTDD